MLENIFYPFKRRMTIMNNEVNTRSILEDVASTEYLKRLAFESIDFWETYYRHNNYFLEKNSSLLHKIKDNKNFVQANSLNNNSIGFEQFIEFYDINQNSLSHIGVRVCSLLDIIKTMSSLGLSISLINKSVKSLADRFKVQTEVIERVFRAAEDGISLRWFKPQVKQAISKTDVMMKVMEYLDPLEAKELVLVSKKTFDVLKEKWITHYLLITDDLLERQSLRVEVWKALIPSRFKNKRYMSWEEVRAKDGLNKEPHEDLIEMDLKRSVAFFDSKNYDKVKLLLMNVTLEYEDSISYYQGMNYIAIFLFETFQHEETAFHFFCYIAEKILCEHFSNSFQGLVKLIWINDKLMQIHSPSLWNKLRNGGVSSIHFSVPNMITLFTSLVKRQESKKYVYEIWDVMFSQGLYAVLKTLSFVLEVQKMHIEEIDPEMLLIAMKDVESDPFSILSHAETDETVLKSHLSQLNKKNLREIRQNQKTYLNLQKFYSDVVTEITDFWAGA